MKPFLITNEEAIVELRDLISDDRTDKENEALLMAIEALRRKALVEKMTKAYYKELKGANNEQNK